MSWSIASVLPMASTGHRCLMNLMTTLERMQPCWGLPIAAGLGLNAPRAGSITQAVSGHRL